MIALHAFALIAALSAPGQQPVLLDFSADWCGPCRSMEPVVRRLTADGYAVRQVNIDREQQLAQRFGVDRVPTFVMTVDGREVDRAVGPVSYDRLTQMFAAARPAAPVPKPAPPSTPSRQTAPPEMRQSAQASPQTRAVQATVRLRVEDPQGNSIGTGTIIDVHGQEALVMTCGHIFRDSGGRGKISVDLFCPGARGPINGELISYDLKHDVALVAIRPGIAVKPMAVAPAGYAVRPGDRVFSVGCDRGADPSVRESHVTAINKFVGPANIVAAGEPVIGRSGGGLFSADGQLIGVCNLADPTDREGIYAALPLLQQSLDKIGQSRIYQRSAPQLASAQTSPSTTRPSRPGPDAPPPMPKQMPASAPNDGRLQPVPPAAVATSGGGPSGPLALASEDTEVICIVRSKSDPRGRNRVVIFDRPSPQLLERLAVESGHHPGAQPIVVEASASDTSIATRPDRGSSQGGRDPVIRAQTLQ